MRRTLSVLLPGLLLGFSALSAHASGGFFEINEACRSVGCFPGDDPATSTIEITSSATFNGVHSFRLSGRLVHEGGTPAIHILADNITLDLQGHEIFCESGTGCSGTGSDGVLVDPNLRATIRNGSITQFSFGIRGSAGAVISVESLQFRNMSAAAAQVPFGVIRDSSFISNNIGVIGFNPGAVLIENNVFVDPRPSSVTERQFPTAGVLGNNACRGNLVAANNRSANINLGNCTEIGSNLCGSARCGLN